MAPGMAITFTFPYPYENLEAERRAGVSTPLKAKAALRPEFWPQPAP